MDASKLTIDPSHLRFDKMTGSRKIKLRKENIKALIRSRPAGSPIQYKEFAAVAATSEGNVYSMMKTMIKKGEIHKIDSDERGQRYAWAVDEAKVIVPKKPKANAPKTYSVEELIEEAKSFAWRENTDSLRGFITSMEGKK